MRSRAPSIGEMSFWLCELPGWGFTYSQPPKAKSAVTYEFLNRERDTGTRLRKEVHSFYNEETKKLMSR